MTKQFLTNVNLLDGLNPALPDQIVVIENDRILAAGHSSELPSPGPDDNVVDLAGKTVMPGMVAGHFHATFHNTGAEPGVPLQEHPPAYTAYLGLVNAQTALQSGFTSVISAGCSYDIDASLEKAINSGLVVGPRLVSCIKLTVDMRAFDAHAPLLSKSPQHFLSIRTVFYLRYVFR